MRTIVDETNPSAMKIASALLILFATTSACFGQSRAFVEDMEEALALEREAATSNFDAILEVAQHLERLSETYASEWLPLYWTAHSYSQCAVFIRRVDTKRFGKYVETAQDFFDRAWIAHPNKTRTEEADFHVLQANIYWWTSEYFGALDDTEHQTNYYTLHLAQLLEAELDNPKNPRLHMLKAMILIREKEDIQRGKAQMQEAIHLFEQFPPQSSIAPSWGRPWIDIWLNAID